MKKIFLLILMTGFLTGCSGLKGNYSATGTVQEAGIGKEASYANIVTDDST